MGEKRYWWKAIALVRLNLLVEGQTEETFVRTVLKEHLAARNVFAYPLIVSTKRKRGRVWRGGVRHYGRIKKDLTIWMSAEQKPGVRFTTMFDLYRLPRDFPGIEKATNTDDPFEHVAELEHAFEHDIGKHSFIPYIQLHEFEALVLADPQKFDWEFINHNRSIRKLLELVGRYDSPERIDDGESTSPSKRIIAEIPEYDGRKASAGPLVAAKIGLDMIRQKCPHFNSWLTQLEKLGESQKDNEPGLTCDTK